MTDVQRALEEAQRAREEAEAAARRAEELAAQAEAARAAAEREAEDRRRAWAQRLVDGYDAQISEADAGIQAAQARFETAAVQDLPGAVAAYVGWAEAAMRHYGLQLRITAAADILGQETTPPELVRIPPFSAALDAALAAAVGERADAARAEAQEELDRLSDAEG